VFTLDSRVNSINAFDNCILLPRFDVPASVQQLDGLKKCCALKKVIFPPESRLDRHPSLSRCLSLSRATIPPLVTNIGEIAFAGCLALNEVIFLEDSCLLRITGFRDCTALETVTIPASVVEIGDYGFENGALLSRLDFSKGSRLQKVDGFRGCGSLVRLGIPRSVVLVTLPEFRDSSALSEIRLPEGTKLECLIFGRVWDPPRRRVFLTYLGDDCPRKRHRFVHTGAPRCLWTPPPSFPGGVDAVDEWGFQSAEEMVDY
jgi:hypothetical protein